MNVTLWIIAGVLALIYLAVGLTKVVQPQEKLATNPNFGWTKDVPGGTVKAIGTAEILGAVGLVAPEAFQVAPVLTPLAATGLVILQIGAAVTHVRRREWKNLPVNLILLLLAGFVAVSRFTS